MDGRIAISLYCIDWYSSINMDLSAAIRLSLKAVGSLDRGFLAGKPASGGGDEANADSAAAICCCIDPGDLTGGAGGAVLGLTVDWYCGAEGDADDVLFGRTGTLEESGD